MKSASLAKVDESIREVVAAPPQHLTDPDAGDDMKGSRS